jgi:ankyrin repeat protein
MQDLTLLQAAISNKNIDDITTLIHQPEIRLSLNNIDNNGQTPLILASIINDPQVIDLLVKNGANVNQAAKGSTALMIAAKSGKKEAVKALILARADINKVVGFGKTTALKLAKQHLSPDEFLEMETVFKDAQAELGVKTKQPQENVKESQIINLTTPQQINSKGKSGGSMIPRKTQGK